MRIRPNLEQWAVPIFAIICRVSECDNEARRVRAKKGQTAKAATSQLARLAANIFQIKFRSRQVGIDTAGSENRSKHFTSPKGLPCRHGELHIAGDGVCRDDDLGFIETFFSGCVHGHYFDECVVAVDRVTDVRHRPFVGKLVAGQGRDRLERRRIITDGREQNLMRRNSDVIG